MRSDLSSSPSSDEQHSSVSTSARLLVFFSGTFPLVAFLAFLATGFVLPFLALALPAAGFLLLVFALAVEFLGLPLVIDEALLAAFRLPPAVSRAAASTSCVPQPAVSSSSRNGSSAPLPARHGKRARDPVDLTGDAAARPAPLRRRRPSPPAVLPPNCSMAREHGKLRAKAANLWKGLAKKTFAEAVAAKGGDGAGRADVAQAPNVDEGEGKVPVGSLEKAASAPASIEKASGADRRSEEPESALASIADYPDVSILLSKLNKRITQLEDIVRFPWLKSSLHSAESMVRPQSSDQDSLVSVQLTSQQQHALRGLSDCVQDLIRCLNKHYRNELKQHQGSNKNKKQSISDIVHLIRSASAPCAIPDELITGSDQQKALFQIYGGVPLRRNSELKERVSLKDIARSVLHINRVANVMMQNVQEEVLDQTDLQYLPREFARLEEEPRRRLAAALSWEGLGAWGFDAFEVECLSRVSRFRRFSTMGRSITRLGDFNDVNESESDQFWDALGEDASEDDQGVNNEPSKHGCPIVLVGWALLSSPYSQLAMARNVNDEGLVDKAMAAIRRRIRTASSAESKMAHKFVELDDAASTAEDEKNTDPGGYFLPDEFEVSPRAVCRFLRRVEQEYSPQSQNPYHSNIHAADVLQATHALLRLGEPNTSLAYAPLEQYSVLLAAAMHDIRHPGTSNSYQVNAETDLSTTYNGVSVLENMHASRAAFLLRADFKGAREGKSGIFGSMKKAQRQAFRINLVKMILGTDMTKHFADVGAMAGYIEAIEEEGTPLLACLGMDKHAQAREAFLPFILHMADISNPARPTALSAEWAKGVYEEFFLQGDREVAEGLPISPLCDRRTTCPYESQVGFMKFVIKPAFVLLARVLTQVEGTVLPHLEENFGYWEEKIKAKSQGGES